MINAIISGISITLDGAFGYEVYGEEIKQGLKEPCFFIKCFFYSCNVLFHLF